MNYIFFHYVLDQKMTCLPKCIISQHHGSSFLRKTFVNNLIFIDLYSHAMDSS